MDMFCYQCEQAYRSTGCNTKGVCGKDPEASGLMDVILHQLKGISYLAHEARLLGKTDSAINRFTLEALFITVTNVNFDVNAIAGCVAQTKIMKENAAELYQSALTESRKGSEAKPLPASVQFVPAATVEALLLQSPMLSILADHPDPDLRSLQHLLVYGIKGMAAYAHHAMVLGAEDDSIYAFIHEGLAALNRKDITLNELVELNMRCGTVNIRCMEILDHAHTGRYGHPEPTTVSTDYKKGPAIIVSGHDLLDLEEILKATDGKGVNVYTHGEMLPAHGYPGLRKYAHLAGHFGSAWQNQQKEFDGVPAAFYFTTNCIQEPKPGYKDQVFTGSVVGWPGVAHIKDGDFTPLINKAIALGGFPVTVQHKRKLTTGFGRNAVLSVAAKVVAAVKSGAIKHFFLVGGCDGAKPGRNYYTNFTQQAPADTVIMTLACGKFRFNDREFGTIGGIPRLLDIGQCNDAYSAIKIAEALAGAFNCGVNDLPLTLVISWYEQKAVAVLLSLLSLGIKGIRLGPTLPAFVTPNVLDFLVKNFDIKPITTPEADLDSMLTVKA
jgi:hydroxylamine reductase